MPNLLFSPVSRMPASDRMTPQELRASFGLAGIFGLRMLGMFIILPVFALYAAKLPGGSSHTMVGIALGAYGLTQACLQVPFGWLSDRWGRKRTIYLGLVIFALGSFIAAMAHDLDMVIIGRIIQGAGAISAAVIALPAFASSAPFSISAGIRPPSWACASRLATVTTPNALPRAFAIASILPA